MIKKAENICTVKGKCFAREAGYCTILIQGALEKCSFCKPERDVTKGKRYPYNPLGRMK